jgi:hypothetical protein
MFDFFFFCWCGVRGLLRRHFGSAFPLPLMRCLRGLAGVNFVAIQRYLFAAKQPLASSVAVQRLRSHNGQLCCHAIAASSVAMQTLRSYKGQLRCHADVAEL